MPEPGIDDCDFDRPTTDRKKFRRRSKARVKLPGEYAEFRLSDGRPLGEVMGDGFFGPASESHGDRPIVKSIREQSREDNSPLARIMRDDPRIAPRRKPVDGIVYRDGVFLPPVLSPRYYRDPVAPVANSEPREPLAEPARTSNIPLPRPEESEKGFSRMPSSQDGDYPDKWAEKGWGGPRGHYGVPTLNNGRERTENILADKPSRFDIRENSKAKSDDPWYASAWAGNAAIASYGTAIEKEAKRQGVDPDLAKAIVYSENARGRYFGSAKAAEGVDMADSFLPMNINPTIWGGLGIDRKSASDYLTNIRAGITLIKRISDRIDNPTPEKVASIWNYTGRELVNDFGAYVGRMYRETPWDD